MILDKLEGCRRQNALEFGICCTSAITSDDTVAMVRGLCDLESASAVVLSSPLVRCMSVVNSMM